MIPIMVRSGSKGMMMFGLLSLMTVSINGFESCYSCCNSLRYYLLLMISLPAKTLIREGSLYYNYTSQRDIEVMTYGF